MDLEPASGRIIRDATSDDILANICGEEFAILSTSAQSSIQCGGQKMSPYEFDLEYRDGSAERHFGTRHSTGNASSSLSATPDATQSGTPASPEGRSGE